jgi:hypothetical protein
MAVHSHATLARLNYTTYSMPLQVNRTATPGWLLAIGIANIGTRKLSDCSVVFGSVLVMLMEVSYSSFSWGPDHHHEKHRAGRQYSALRATLPLSGRQGSGVVAQRSRGGLSNRGALQVTPKEIKSNLRYLLSLLFL